jgi:hypothetical protein
VCTRINVSQAACDPSDAQRARFAVLEGSGPDCYVGGVEDGDPSEARSRLVATTDELDELDELPVVARMVVEIRSDGTRTIARGALEDRASGQRVAIELTPTSPWALAKSMAKLLLGAPWRRGVGLRRRLRGGE